LLYMSTQEKRHFNEVIFGFMPQKLKFDIDAPASLISAFMAEFTDLQATSDAIKHILSYIVSSIRNVFYIIYQRELDPNEIIYCESKDVTKAKYSFHIIINYAVSGHHQAEYFTEKLRTHLPTAYQRF